MGSLTTLSERRFEWFVTNSMTQVVIRAEAGQKFQLAVAGENEVHISVARTLPPTLSLLSPANDTEFIVGETVNVTADVVDPDGPVSRVEFYRNRSLIVVATNPPFNASFTLDEPSSWLIEAIAFDEHNVPSSGDSRFIRARMPGPPNDAFTNRLALSGVFTNITGTTADATFEPEEREWTRVGSAWWEWAAPASGTFTVTVRSERGYWLSVAVLTGTNLSDLLLLTAAASQHDASDYYAQVTFEAEAGVKYPIAVASGDAVALSIAQTAPPVVTLVQPAPDSVFRTGDMVTLQAEAEDSDGRITKVEFYNWRTLLGTVTEPPFVLQTNFSPGYWWGIRARAFDNHGLYADSATVSIEVRSPPPANDNFVNATPLSGWFIQHTANDRESTVEPDEPVFTRATGSIWWSWTAPASGRVLLFSDAYNGHLAVCAGINVAELTVLAFSKSIGSGMKLEFDAVAGESYPLLFQSESGSAGDFRLDLLLDARELVGLRTLSRGRFALDLYTTLDRTWTVQVTTNLVDWLPLATSPGPNGAIHFLDPPQPGRQQRFYRAIGEP